MSDVIFLCLLVFLMGLCFPGVLVLLVLMVTVVLDKVKEIILAIRGKETK